MSHELPSTTIVLYVTKILGGAAFILALLWLVIWLGKNVLLLFR